MKIPEYAPRVRANRSVFRGLGRDITRSERDMATAKTNAERVAREMQNAKANIAGNWQNMQTKNQQWLEKAEKIAEMQADIASGGTGGARDARAAENVMKRLHTDAERLKADVQRERDAAAKVLADTADIRTALSRYLR